MKVAVVKYNAGNIRSVDYALKRLGVEAVITADKEELQSADKVIFPGVGEAETTMNHLKATGLDELIKNLRQPVFGICLGMQLMCRHSEEGEVDCLNIFDVDVKRFVPQKHEDKVPHMGWNTIGKTNSKLFEGFTEEEFVYFVHSFYVPTCDFTAATTDYIHQPLILLMESAYAFPREITIVKRCIMRTRWKLQRSLKRTVFAGSMW